jgi:hypothetical protein
MSSVQTLDKVEQHEFANHGSKPLIAALSDEEVGELLGGSGPTMYCVAGWLFVLVEITSHC